MKLLNKWMLLLLCAVMAQMVSADEWYDIIKMKGDFRYRFDYIDQDNKDKRYRNRIRARLGLSAKVHDDISVGLKLASGSSDPVSTNETLDSGFSSKGINLDLAYVSYTPTFNGSLEGLGLHMGKVKNPWFKPGGTELLWDGDLNPEGIHVGYSKKFEMFKFDINTAGFWVEERSGGPDSGLFGAQFHGTFMLMDEKFDIDFALGYFDYGNVKDNSYIVDQGGNTDNGSGSAYRDDFDLIEFSLMGTYHFDFAPVSIFVDFVSNGGSSGDEDTGFLIGFQIGKAKKPGSWQFAYNYRKVEADAVLGAFTDSDFINGGANGKGHEIMFAYQIYKGWQVGLNLFVNEIGTSNGVDFNRVLLDMQYKF